MALKHTLALGLFTVGSLCAQEYFPHHNFTFGVGAARPRGDLGPALTDAPAITVGYGYRFHRYFQADIGLDMAFGAADVRDYLQTGIGDLRIRDREYFLPLGGRAIIPVLGGRLQFSGGGGGAYMRYAESVRQPSDYFRVDCPVCTSRSGWGWYALVNASLAIDRGQHFRLGVTGKSYRGDTEGEPLGNVPGLRTHDKWLSIFGQFGFSF
jgi:hypothetical protein